MTKTASAGGAGEGSQNDPIVNDDDSSGGGAAPKGGRVIKPEDHERALADLNKFKKAAKEAADKLAERERKELEQQSEWKKLYEQEKAAREAAEGKATKLSESVVNEKKYTAVKTAALAAGLRPEAVDDLDMIEFEDVVVESTSTGRFNVHGVENQVKKLQAAKPHWFGGKTAPKINGANPRTVEGGDGDEVTVDMVRKAAAEAKKTKDPTKYNELITRYRAKHGRRLSGAQGVR